MLVCLALLATLCQKLLSQITFESFHELGISILAHLIEVDVSYAFRHQMTVIDCLNDPDDTLKRKVRSSFFDFFCMGEALRPNANPQSNAERERLSRKEEVTKVVKVEPFFWGIHQLLHFYCILVFLS